MGRVPRRRRYYGRLRLLVTLPAVLLRASFPSLGGTSRARHVRVPHGLLRARRAARAGLGLGCGSPVCSAFVRRWRDLPGSWGATVCACPALRPRWSLGAHDPRALRYCLPLTVRRRPPRLLTFGAQSHGPHTRCLRFAAVLADGSRARLASGCDQLCRAARLFRGREPPGASGGFRDDHPLIASSSSRLPGAHSL